MRYGIISDIHSNLEALKAVIHACKQQDVQAFLCVGDIVGYGADPDECIDIVRKSGAICVAGNHDWAVIGRLDPSYFTNNGKAGILYSQNHLSFENFDFLNALDLIFKNEDLVLVHGTLNNPGQFNYLNDIAQSPDTFYLSDRKICFVGHVHVPGIYIQRKDNIYYASSNEVETDQENKYIVNVGSVGQPRDGNPAAAYCIYDTEAEMIEIKRVRYDIKSAQEKIFRAGLPEILGYRLGVGQ